MNVVLFMISTLGLGKILSKAVRIDKRKNIRVEMESKVSLEVLTGVKQDYLLVNYVTILKQSC